MPQRFTLRLTRVECLNEQAWEWGKDEMRMFGSAISRKGHLFATGYRSLGSYGEGDVRTDGIFPMTIVDTELEDDGLEVLFYVWLVEEDGGVRDSAAALEIEFRERFRAEARQLLEFRFPRDCIPFTAFYKAALPLNLRIQDAGTKGRNDEVYDPFEALIDRPTGGIAATEASGQFFLRRSKRLGDYLLTFRYGYSQVPVILG